MKQQSMRTVLARAAVALALTLGAAAALSQEKTQTITVPLSRPDEALSLKIEVPSARIEVVGENRRDAEFVITALDGERKIVMPSGAKTLPGGSYEMRVHENDNAISVESDWPAGAVQITARIPRRADLDLSTHRNGEIAVRDIAGNLYLENTNGPISAINIDGSVIAESLNESVKVSFSAISVRDATALSSLNGDISLSIPAAVGIELRIDKARGEIESDFEMDVKPSKPVIERDDGNADRDGVSVRVQDPIVATINGGGPVIRIKTLNGSVRIGKSGKQ